MGRKSIAVSVTAGPERQGRSCAFVGRDVGRWAGRRGLPSGRLSPRELRSTPGVRGRGVRCSVHAERPQRARWGLAPRRVAGAEPCDHPARRRPRRRPVTSPRASRPGVRRAATVPAAPAGGGVRGWGRDGLGTGTRGRGARARRAFVLPSLCSARPRRSGWPHAGGGGCSGRFSRRPQLTATCPPTRRTGRPRVSSSTTPPSCTAAARRVERRGPMPFMT